MEDAKPNGRSVTAVACKCRVLRRLADAPEAPVTFDDALNEYHLIHAPARGTRYTIFYHCPSCGGATPPSNRGALFVVIPDEEDVRLRAIMKAFAAIDDAISSLGPPDEDNSAGFRYTPPEGGGTTAYRSAVFRKLSTTADVVLIDFGPPRGLGVNLVPKRR